VLGGTQFPDCSYTKYGLSALYGARGDYVLTPWCWRATDTVKASTHMAGRSTAPERHDVAATAPPAVARTFSAAAILSAAAVGFPAHPRPATSSVYDFRRRQWRNQHLDGDAMWPRMCERGGHHMSPNWGERFLPGRRGWTMVSGT